MKRTTTRWNLVLAALVTLLPLLAMGCQSTKQTNHSEVYSENRPGTVEWLLKKQ